MSINILSLPTEILQDICSRLCQHCNSFAEKDSRVGLANLLHTTHALREAALPIRFHEVSIQRDADTYQQLCILYARPDIALAVKSLKFLACRYKRLDVLKMANLLGHQVITEAGITLPELNNNEDGTSLGCWLDSFLIDLFLIRTANIERVELRLTWDAYVGEHLPDDFLLPHLKKISAAAAQIHGGFSIHILDGFFSRAPNLEVLDLKYCSEVSEEVVLLNVKEINMAYSSIDESGLESIPRLCPNLETFKYESGGILVGNGVSDFTCASVRETLLPLEKTLRNLKIDLAESADDDEFQNYNPLGSLRSYTTLETLIVSYDSVWDEPDDHSEAARDDSIFVDLLPQSIQKFELWGRASEGHHLNIFNSTLRLAEAASEGQFPDLITFVYGYFSEEQQATVEAALEIAGIKFVRNDSESKIKLYYDGDE